MPIAPPVVVLGLHAPAQRAVHLVGELRLAVLAHQRQHRRLHRRQARVQAQDRAHLALARALALDEFLVVGVHQERERRAVRARRRLDHVRHVALAACLVEVLELLARELARAG